MPEDIAEGTGGSEGSSVGLPRRPFHYCLAPTGSYLNCRHQRQTPSPWITKVGLLCSPTQTNVAALELTEIRLSLPPESQD